jgi:hypothetical protein
MLGVKSVGKLASMGMKIHGGLRAMGMKTPLKSAVSAMSNIISPTSITSNQSNQAMNQYLPSGLAKKSLKVAKSYIEKQ